jgi:1,4-dihydroxy-6-naphthoate synthase
MSRILIAHSPDSDDAFMFYALITGKVGCEQLEFEQILADIETLNQKALKGEYEVSAVSIHAYPYIADKYVLMNSGASMGYNYGPIVVSKEPMESLKGKKVAVPGKLTSAFLELKLYEEEFTPIFINFDRIIDAVDNEKVDAGLIIHEGQLTYRSKKLYKVVDLGEWWYEETGLPLPLGGNVIRKDIGKELMEKIALCVKKSILYAQSHEDEALEYAMKFGRGLRNQEAKKFVRMYVNEFTVDYGEKGREAVRLLLERGYERGLIPVKVEPEFIG